MIVRKVQLDTQEFLSQIFIYDHNHSFAPVDDISCRLEGVTRPCVLHDVKDDVVGIPAAAFWLMHTTKSVLSPKLTGMLPFVIFFADGIVAKLHVVAIESIIENLPKPAVFFPLAPC
jgi:hypothetical protein